LTADFSGSVGDRRSVKFWEDRWVDGQALKEKFLRLYSIFQNKDSLVRDLAEWEVSRSSRCKLGISVGVRRV